MEIVIGGLVVGVIVIVIALLVLRSKDDQDASPTKTLPTAKPSSATTRAKRANWFVGEAGVAQSKTYHIGTREVTIGRKIGNYIQLADEKVSRTHLKVRGTNTGVSIEDLGSEIGTMVNGDKLVSGVQQQLNDGDQIQIGDTVFVYHKEGNFGTNHGLTDQKVAGTMQHKKTAAMGAIDWKDEVQNALDAADGDIAEAAKAMNMEEEVFRKVMERAGVSAE